MKNKAYPENLNNIDTTIGFHIWQIILQNII